MGTVLGGIVFKKSDDFLFENAIEAIFNSKPIEIEQPNGREFDIRNPNDILCFESNGAAFICNADFSFYILLEKKSSQEFRFPNSGVPAKSIIFSVFDSGGTYGYGLVDDFKLHRVRIQTSGDFPPENEWGLPNELELDWLDAPFSIERDDDDPDDEGDKLYVNTKSGERSSEYWLSNRILNDLIKSDFGVNLHDVSPELELRFFRISNNPYHDLL